jgi:hypothetical protein
MKILKSKSFHIYTTLLLSFLLTGAIYITKTQAATSLSSRLQGYILLQVEDNGESWYVVPKEGERVYMQNGSSAYQIMRYLSLGITDADLSKIPVGIESRFNEQDQDQDGLSDRLEEGLGTDPNKADTDNDSFSDGEELKNNFNPLGSSKLTYNTTLTNRLKGYILLQVEKQGQAWYLNPKDGKRYYMQDGDAAYQIMRFLSLGITNQNLNQIRVSTRTFSVNTNPPGNNNPTTPPTTPSSTPPIIPPSSGGGGGGGGTTPPTPDYDSDNDGYDSTSNGGSDCNDNNSSIRPNATEICDSIDNDCDSQTDEGNVCVTPTPDYDSDNDGYDSTSNGGDDCNDSSASIHPGATEVCSDSIDQDCSGADLACSTCSEGLIASRCLCGSTAYASGYCCSNIYQTNSCTVVDTQSPSIPTNLNVSVSGTQATLTWTASTDNIAVTGYNILRSATSGGPYTQIATSATNSYTNTGLSYSTTYYYVVQAYDAASNTSASSSQAQATTVSAPVAGSPAISGLSSTTLVDGQSYTISGSNFGAHANYNNLGDTWQENSFLNFRYKDFEDGVFESDGFTTGFDDSRKVVNSGGHIGSYGNVSYGSIEERVWFGAYNSNQATGKFYSSFWFMMPPETQSGKFFRMYFADDTSHVLSLYTGCTNNCIRAGGMCGVTGIETIWSSPNQFQPNIWHRVELLVLISESNLSVHTWMDGVLQWSMLPACTTLVFDPEGHTWELANYIDEPTVARCAAHPTWNGSYNYDDIYYDYTQARVEIGNAATFATSVHREIQLPKIWSDEEIEFTTNIAGFSQEEKDNGLYLFVIDENRNVSEGYPITLN